MKFRVTFKDPDCMVQGLGSDVEHVDQLPEAARELTDKYFEWSEYVTIEFDTSDDSAKLVPVDEY